MIRSRRRIVMSAAVLAAVPGIVLVAGCGSSDDSTASTGADATITIAMEGPLTGEQASNGQDMLRGVQLAVDEANAKGGILGRQITLMQADDKADPATGKQVAQAVVDGEAVAVVGPYNSAVGIDNLPIYVDGKVVPVQMTSSDDTTGEGVTVQPKNSQISPVEIGYIAGLTPAKVSMIVDPSAYTRGMADRLRAGLSAKGINVSSVAITEGRKDYSTQVRQALTDNPEVVYVSTYFPEGSIIARDLQAQATKGNTTTCFMGLANQDPGFITSAGIPASENCMFSGVPTPDQFPTAAAYVRAYSTRFSKKPGVWGTFTYDSTNVLFDAMRTAKSTDYDTVLDHLRKTSAFPGATGAITIDPETGNRVNAPVRILKVNGAGDFIVVG